MSVTFSVSIFSAKSCIPLDLLLARPGTWHFSALVFWSTQVCKRKSGGMAWTLLQWFALVFPFEMEIRPIIGHLQCVISASVHAWKWVRPWKLQDPLCCNDSGCSSLSLSLTSIWLFYKHSSHQTEQDCQMAAWQSFHWWFNTCAYSSQKPGQVKCSWRWQWNSHIISCT